MRSDWEEAAWKMMTKSTGPYKYSWKDLVLNFVVGFVVGWVMIGPLILTGYFD
jgi:hypothetical protein